MEELWIKTRNCEFTLGSETTLEIYDRFIRVRKVDWIICCLIFPDEGSADEGLQKIVDSVSKGHRSIELMDAEAQFDMTGMNWRSY